MKGRIGTKNYNTETAEMICNTPYGILYRKRGKAQDFFLFKANGTTVKERFVDVPWTKANDLVQQFGAREVYINLFTTFSASKTATPTNRKSVYLDDYHYVQATRNAARLKLSVKDYICRLIERDDANNNWRH